MGTMAHSRPPHNNTALGTIMVQLLNASPMDGTKRDHGRAIYSFVQFAAEHFQGIPSFPTSTSILSSFIARLRVKHYMLLLLLRLMCQLCLIFINYLAYFI